MNHFAKNIITKGWLNISALYKGFILPHFKYEIRRNRGGSPQLTSGYKEEQLYRDLRKEKEEDVDVIVVYVEWDKKLHKYDKHIYVELIHKKISAKLLEQNLPNYKIDVQIIKNDYPQ